MPNSVPVNSLRIEDEHEQEDEDDLVADLGVSSVERLGRTVCRPVLPMNTCGKFLTVSVL